MKPAGNSSITRINYGQATAARINWGGLHIPAYVWLVMIIAAAAALSVSTVMRARAQARQAQASLIQVSESVRQAQAENSSIRQRIERLKKDPQAAEAAARAQMRYLSANEIPVKLREQ